MRDPLTELAALRDAGLLRTLNPLAGCHGPVIERGGAKLWNFSSNDYLGLAADPRIASALIEGVARHGAGAGAARLLTGSHPAHDALEQALATAKGSEAALVFSSGFATAVGALPALAGKGDTLILDKLCHACLIDGARLSGATIRVFPHNDLDKLASLLESSCSTAANDARVIVVTESLFSMDGDLCPLREIVELKEKFGALLLLDEAHAFGVLGPTGLGLAEELGLQQQIDFQMGTLSKAAGLAGGFIATSRAFADLLVNRARSFVFSTAPPPALCHAASAALDLIRSHDGAALRQALTENIRLLATSLGGCGLSDCGTSGCGVPPQPERSGDGRDCVAGRQSVSAASCRSLTSPESTGCGLPPQPQPSGDARDCEAAPQSLPAPSCRSPIFPVILGENEATLAASLALEQAGFLVPAIRYPTVPRGTARLRISLSAAHPAVAVQALALTLQPGDPAAP